MLNYHKAYHGKSLAEVGAEEEEEWVIVAKKGVTDAQIKEMCAVARNGCKLSGHPSQGGVPFLEMRGTEDDLEAVISSGRGAVEFIEPDSFARAIPALETDIVENELWGLTRVGAYQRTATGSGVAVFVLDSGIRTTHEEFGGRAIPTLDLSSGGVEECDGRKNCARDRDGHGTHCAGTAGGASYGVAPGATLHSAKVLGDDGWGQWSWSYAALDWIATSNIRPVVGSMSLGGSGTPPAMRTAIRAATNAGIIMVVAAGNENSDACDFSPAFVPAAIAVGSTDSLDRRSSWSNFGACTDIWAPGSAILSATHRSDTASASWSGTSMACPHVAGGAALVLQRNPTYTAAKVLEQLQADAINGVITDLKDGDTNKLLFVGA